MVLDTVRKLEAVSSDTDVSAFRRLFGETIVLVNYTSLRFADAQRASEFDIDDDLVFWTLSTSKAKTKNTWPSMALGVPEVWANRLLSAVRADGELQALFQNQEWRIPDIHVSETKSELQGRFLQRG